MDMRRVIRAHNKKYHVGYQKKMSGLKAAVDKWNLVPTPTGKGRKAKMSAADRKTNQKKYRGTAKAKSKANLAAKIRRIKKKGQSATTGTLKGFSKF